MTRANVVLITYQGKFKFQGNSSCYPSNIGDYFFDLISKVCKRKSYDDANIEFWDSPDAWDLATFIEKVGLTLGHVGNPSYYYEVDFVNHTFKVWDSSLRWVNAPEDWKARGWNCWLGKNGKYGYTNWVKGKLLYNRIFQDMVYSITPENKVEMSDEALQTLVSL